MAVMIVKRATLNVDHPEPAYPLRTRRAPPGPRGNELRQANRRPIPHGEDWIDTAPTSMRRIDGRGLLAWLHRGQRTRGGGPGPQ